ncbi:hypothetical protein [Eleftheria terrae]|uniref:hypothetical protein n=1 Tax=Eleftheria terrae TaxID=1597781 RepID=UPI00263BBF6A|nr:hypothetical protein [Eleftheria terrae]WKB51635.1 hypothetical protein N7L95_17780 [Eleftheria terrae]
MKLDDPAEFAVWAVISSGKVGEFRRWMALRKKTTELSIHQIYGQALKMREPVQLYSGIGWEEVAPLLESLPTFVEPGSEKVSETDLFPGPKTPFCAEHRLYHRGGTCPISTGDFIRRGIRSQE